ncbi:MAG TPA: hypothetical protein VF175_15880, partial [Lacipirellula sp.]
MPRIGTIVCAALWAAIWTAGPGSQSASAQVRLPDGRVVQQQSRVQPFSDRTATRGIRRAEEAIAAGQFTQAIQYLDSVLASGEDKFVDAGVEGGYTGLKERARQLIGDLPPEGRQAYEAAFSAAAARMLDEAIEAGDAAAMQAVARRYFYTSAGYDAAFLLAMDEADAGNHLSAALNYQQLLESPEAAAKFEPHLSLRAAASWLAAGEEARAREILEGLYSRGHRTVQVGGRQHRLDAADQSLSWLRNTVGDLAISDGPQEQWLTYRGNAARNSATAGGLPHMRVRWKVRLLGHPQLETLYENYIADLTRTASIAPIASNSLAVGDYILTRTPHGLLAVDFRTGKRIWRSEPQTDPQLDALMRHGAAAEEEAAQQQAMQSFARRMWEDRLYGIVS